MFSQKLEMALVTAVRQAKNHRHEFVTVEHLLYGILQDDLINRIIKQCGGSLENLQKRLEKFFDGELPTQKISDANAPVQTLGFNRVLQRAIGHVQSCGKEEVDSGDILVAIFSELDSHAVYFLSSEPWDRSPPPEPRSPLQRIRATSRPAVPGPSPPASGRPS